jgi:hypothetical protein
VLIRTPALIVPKERSPAVGFLSVRYAPLVFTPVVYQKPLFAQSAQWERTALKKACMGKFTYVPALQYTMELISIVECSCTFCFCFCNLGWKIVPNALPGNMLLLKVLQVKRRV